MGSLCNSIVLSLPQHQMGASSTTIGDLRNLQPDRDVVLPQPAADLDGRADAQQGDQPRARTHTLYVLIFRGHPRDSIRARKAELFIVDDDASETNITYRLEGQRGSYWLSVTSNPRAPHARPHYLRNYHVATVSVQSAGDMTLHELITGTAIQNTDPEWSRFNWIQDVLSRLSTAGIITTEDGDEVFDQTVNVIYDAPYPEADD